MRVARRILPTPSSLAGSNATQAPGVTLPAKILAKHPYTLLIAGHTHTLSYKPTKREFIVGNGGAPTAGAVHFGYVVARQRDDGAIEFRARDYGILANFMKFAVQADGSPAP